MKYKVFITEKSEEDLNLIADYLLCKLLAGESGLRQMDRLEQAVMSLDEMPERFRLYDKEPWREKNLRVMSVDNYLAFYIVDKDEKVVTIMRIMYGKRDIDTQLSQD